jgi:hypothetical protein
MAQLQKSVVALRIWGDDLTPDEITTLLGASPTRAQTKGDRFVGKKTRHVRIAKAGMWSLCASDREPEDMDGQIHEILSQLTGDLTVWQTITRKYYADLFCGLFMRVGNEGLTVSSQSLAALGARGIEMGLDIYAGDDDEDETSTEAVMTSDSPIACSCASDSMLSPARASTA